jgi:hypothetical protein
MSKRQTCAPTAHAFDKFDDSTIFCRNCGEQRVVNVKALVASPRIWYGSTTTVTGPAGIGNAVTLDPTVQTTLTVKS